MVDFYKKTANLVRGTIGSIVLYSSLIALPVFGTMGINDLTFNDIDQRHDVKSQELTNNFMQNMDDILYLKKEISMYKNASEAAKTAGLADKVIEHTQKSNAISKLVTKKSTNMAVSILTNPQLTELNYKTLADKFTFLNAYSNIDLIDDARSFDEARSYINDNKDLAVMTSFNKAQRIEKELHDDKFENDGAEFFVIMSAIGMGIFSLVFGLGDLFDDIRTRKNWADKIEEKGQKIARKRRNIN